MFSCRISSEGEPNLQVTTNPLSRASMQSLNNQDDGNVIDFSEPRMPKLQEPTEPKEMPIESPILEQLSNISKTRKKYRAGFLVVLFCICLKKLLRNRKLTFIKSVKHSTMTWMELLRKNQNFKHCIAVIVDASKRNGDFCRIGNKDLAVVTLLNRLRLQPYSDEKTAAALGEAIQAACDAVAQIDYPTLLEYQSARSSGDLNCEACSLLFSIVRSHKQHRGRNNAGFGIKKQRQFDQHTRFAKQLWGMMFGFPKRSRKHEQSSLESDDDLADDRRRASEMQRQLVEYVPQDIKSLILHFVVVRIVGMKFLLNPEKSELVGRISPVLHQNLRVTAFILYRIVRGVCARNGEWMRIHPLVQQAFIPRSGTNTRSTGKQSDNRVELHGANNSAFFSDRQFMRVYQDDAVSFAILMGQERLTGWIERLVADIRANI
ncbi:hypothetical protein BJ742DRAFT_155211 [Cladochytrium replicatum]|nr:hypothetical protein BJ742DRAFT_155211 [Cladochytrium replicatum]